MRLSLIVLRGKPRMRLGCFDHLGSRTPADYNHTETHSFYESDHGSHRTPVKTPHTAVRLSHNNSSKLNNNPINVQGADA